MAFLYDWRCFLPTKNGLFLNRFTKQKSFHKMVKKIIFNETVIGISYDNIICTANTIKVYILS